MYVSQTLIDHEKIVLEVCRRFDSQTITSLELYNFLSSWFEEYVKDTTIDDKDPLRSLLFEGIPEDKMSSVDVFPIYRKFVKLDAGDGKVDVVGFPLILMEIYG